MKVGLDGTRRLRLLSSGAVENRMDVVVLAAILGVPYLQNCNSDIQLGEYRVGLTTDAYFVHARLWYRTA